MHIKDIERNHIISEYKCVHSESKTNLTRNKK